MDIKQRIIQEADTLFCKWSFKSITMDDIAKQLGMSKKTIYQYYKNKDELINKIMIEKLAAKQCGIKERAKNAKNAVHELYLGMMSINDALNDVNPKIFYDIQKYHPNAWQLLKNFREQTLAESIKNNLKRGIKEGFFRKEINIDILTAMRLEQSDVMFNQNETYTMHKYNITEVMAQITEHFLHGICNEKGLEELNKYKRLSSINE